MLIVVGAMFALPKLSASRWILRKIAKKIQDFYSERYSAWQAITLG